MTEDRKQGSARARSRSTAVLVASVISGALVGLYIGLQAWGEGEAPAVGETVTEKPAVVERQPLPEVTDSSPPLKKSSKQVETGPSRPIIVDIPPQEQAAPPPAAVQTRGEEQSSEPAGGASADTSVPEQPDRKQVALAIPSPEKRPERSHPSVAPGDSAFYDKALAPLINLKVSEGDIKRLKEAVRLFYKDNFKAGKPLLRKIKDPTARKIGYWYYLRSSELDASASEIARFRAEHPLWPSKELMDKRAEYALFMKKVSPDKVLAYFKEREPQTGAGKAALGAAYLAKGKKERGEALVREAWRYHALKEDAEERMLERFGKILTKQDHKYRADWLLMQDRRSYIAAARRLKKRLDKKDQQSLDARAANVRRSRKSGRLLTRLSEDIKQDPAVLLSRVRWLRRHNKDKKAWSLLRSAPTDTEKVIDPAKWWDERRIHVREALNRGHAKTAYAIAANHGGVTGDDLEEAEFLAGWIALRFLGRPKDAKKHFLAGQKAADLPKDRARMHYWLGRAELELGNTKQAIASLRKAARHFHTYYGQLARQALQDDSVPPGVLTQVKPTDEEIERFRSRHAVRALMVAKQADFESFVPLFLFELARELKSPGEMTLLGELARRIAPPNNTVRMAKIALNRGFSMEAYAYPTDLPDFEMLSGATPVEPALLYALTRQESEFDPGAKSRSGARGLMQLMPATARMVARLHNVKYRLKRLNDPEYNVKLGSAFLRRLLETFDGSYAMTLAGYNAGPGRVREWVRQFGDPRDPKVDPVDWVERIPFTETRKYVQKIMESIQVYRVLLKARDPKLTLVYDLHRGRSGGVSSPIYAGITN